MHISLTRAAAATLSTPLLASTRARGVDVDASMPVEPVLGALLDELDYGVVVLRDATFVVWLNRAARAEIRTGGAVSLIDGHLRADLPGDNPMLAEAAHAAACRGLRRLVTLGTEAESLSVAFVPLGPAAADHVSTTVAMFGRRRLCERLSVQWFARRHGLTSAEAEVLERLCDGLDPRAIADAQGVQLSTVRTHLGRIREKTGSTGIRQVLQQLALLPPIVSVLQR